MPKTATRTKSKKTLYYYRIYDDNEQVNFIKSSLEAIRIRKLLQSFEKTHQVYYNAEFVNFLKTHDPTAGMIEVTTITY
jgi:hypothetical protein